MHVVLVAPDNKTLLDSPFTENKAMNAHPAVSGTYKLTVTNTGGSSIRVDVVFGHLPGAGPQDSIWLTTFGGVVVGIIIITIGVIVMIAGGVIVIIDRRS